jgi:transcriptional regulator with XRE-family HTH domain
MRSGLEQQHDYDAARLLDLLRVRLAVVTDAQLARRLDLRAPIISKIRHRRQSVTAAFLVRVHEETGIEVAELRRMLGCRRRRWRLAPQGGPSG